MEVTTTNTSTTSGKSAAQSATSEATTSFNADFNTFLKMLTTQLENQDPTDPVNSSEFAVQLATFSGVEQQIRTNELLGEVNENLGVSNLSELAGWVGQEARVAGTGWYDGVSVTLQIDPDSKADEAILVVRDPSGKVVARDDVPLSGGTIDWSGVDSEGNPLGSGVYDFELESRLDDKVLSTRPVEAYSQITEAQAGKEGTVLILKGGIQVDSTEVTALRAN